MQTIIKPTLVLLFIGLIIVILIQGQIPNRSSDTKAVSEQITVEVCLEYLGEKYDKFFTVEGVMREPVGAAEIESPIEYKLIAKPLDKSNLDKDLQEIQRLLPQFIYWTDAQNPRLIHIMDIQLSRISSYALEQIIENLEFEGRITQLANEIGKHNIAIARPTGCFTPCFGGGEGKVKIKVQNIKVRDALSNYIDLNNRVGSRILWKATTYPNEKKTYVEFFGGIDKAEQPKD